MKSNVAVVALLGLFVGAPAHAAGWELTTTKGSLKIYKREKAGSEVKEVKAVGIIKAPAHAAKNVLDDLEHYPDFMPYVETAKILKRNGRTIINYQYLDTPLIADRDYVIERHDESSWGKDGKPIYKLRWTSAKPGVGPKPTDDAVRLTTVNGSWLLEPIDDNTTKGTYYLHTDPGGSLPGFVVNMANGKAIPGVFEAVEKQANKEKYKSKTPAYPEASAKP